MAFNIGIAFMAASLWLNTVHGYTTERLSATKNSKGKYLYSYNNNDRRIFYIAPSAGYNDGKNYLEITWSKFDIRGYMPSCYNDRVEVYLTRSYRSIGKFCSYSAAKPFTMYSHDGYAKIELVSDSKTTGGGFTFYYRLRSKTSNILGGSTSSTTCYNTNNYKESQTLYSTGWPVSYARSYIECKYQITRSSAYDYTKIVFMDVDLASGDRVKVYGSNSFTSSKYYRYRAYSTGSYTRTYTTTLKYLEIKFSRSYGYGSPSGFVIGYIQYSKSSSTNPGSSTDTPFHFSATYLTPIFVIIILAITFSFVRRRRQLYMRRSNVAACAVMTTNNTRCTLGRDASQPVPPSYPESEPPPQPYPTSYGASSLSTCPPPNYAYTVASKDDPMPAFNVPPPYPVLSSEYPSTVPYPPVTSQFSSGMQPPPVTSQAPMAPPPSYDTAVQK